MNEEVIIEDGVVISVENGFADVSVIQSEKCDECSAKIICHPNKNDLNILHVEDPFGAKVGDNVRIEIRGKSILKASFKLYGIPLIILLIGIFLGNSIFTGYKISELFSVLLGVGLVIIYYFLTFSHQKNHSNQILPKIVFVNRIL
jgi:sigma-E factor negative regulatory protein RseC